VRAENRLGAGLEGTGRERVRLLACRRAGERCQLVMLGSGRADLEEALREMENK
jgi:hypothetical protein